MKNIRVVLTIALLAAGVGYSAVLLSDAFESGTPGAQPAATFMSPSVNTVDNHVTVIDSVANKAGTGQGIQFYDTSATVGTRVDFDLSGSASALRFDYSFSPLNTGGSGTVNYMTVGVSAIGMSTGTGTNRYCEMRLYDSGQVRFYIGGSVGSTRLVTNSAAYNVSMFVNDGADAIVYTGQDGSTGNALGANQVAYWMNNQLIISGSLSGPNVITTNGLGRIGFASSTTLAGINYAIDNLAVTDLIPAGPLPVAALLTEGFESDVAGSRPVHNGAISSPSVITVTNFAMVVDSSVNTAGPGQGIQLYDNGNGSGGLEYNFVAGSDVQRSAVKVDFAFSWKNDITGADSNYVAVGLGAYNTSRSLSSGGARFTEARLCADGTVDFRSTSSGTNNNNAVVAGAANTMTLFANDNDAQAVSYTVNNTTYALAANSVAYWLNGSMITFDGAEYASLDLSDVPAAGGTIGTTTNNFGKFGFTWNSTASAGTDFVVDDIVIAEVPTNALYTLTVTGSGGGFYTNQQQVAISANKMPSRTFVAWIGDTQAVAGVTASNAAVTMPASPVTLIATYNFSTLTVSGGSNGGTYTNGAQVVIVADAPASGKVFNQWVGATQYVSSVTSSNTLVSMPGYDIALTATYKDDVSSYTLTGSAGPRGTVSPASTNVLSGSSAAFVVTADSYYRIESLTINGDAVAGMSFDNSSTDASFTWTNVTAAGVLAATFTAQVTDDPANTPYEWLAQYGLTNFDADAVADEDIDGLAAWQEYIAGTNPTNPASGFRVVESPRNVLSWNAVSGRVYSVYWSTNLLSGFQCLDSNVAAPQSSYTNETTVRDSYYKLDVRLP